MNIYLTQHSQIEPKVSIDLNVDETLALDKFLHDRYPQSWEALVRALEDKGEAYVPDAIERVTRFVAGPKPYRHVNGCGCSAVNL